MNGTQLVGLVVLAIGALAYMKQRGLCVLCRPGERALASEGSGLMAVDLYPEPPSDLGTWFDMLVSEIDSSKRAGNASGEPATPSSRPTAVKPIPNLAPSLDEWMPPNPVNPDLAAGTEDAPQLDAFSDAGSFESVAWTLAPNTEVANESHPLDYVTGE